MQTKRSKTRPKGCDTMNTEDLGKVETINLSLHITVMKENSRASFKN